MDTMDSVMVSWAVAISTPKLSWMSGTDGMNDDMASGPSAVTTISITRKSGVALMRAAAPSAGSIAFASVGLVIRSSWRGRPPVGKEGHAGRVQWPTAIKWAAGRRDQHLCGEASGRLG